MLFNKKNIIISIVVVMITITLVSYLNEIRRHYISSVNKCKQYNAELLEMMN